MAVQQISYNNKRSGDLWTSNEVNEVKSVVNHNASELSALQSSVSGISQQVFNGEVQQTDTEVLINPNVLNVWGSVESLIITFAAGTSRRYNEYMLQFTVDGDEFSLTLPSAVRWIEEPEWEDGSTYQVSIQNNLAIAAGWEAAQS